MVSEELWLSAENSDSSVDVFNNLEEKDHVKLWPEMRHLIIIIIITETILNL